MLSTKQLVLLLFKNKKKTLNRIRIKLFLRSLEHSFLKFLFGQTLKKIRLMFFSLKLQGTQTTQMITVDKYGKFD